MYGRYTKDLGEFAKEEARKLAVLEKRRRKADRQVTHISLLKFTYNIRFYQIMNKNIFLFIIS